MTNYIKHFITSLFVIFYFQFQVSCSAQTKFLYTLTSDGGANGRGAIIKFNPTTNEDTVVWSFGGGNDASSPLGDLAFDENNGLFYGLTSVGGSNLNIYGQGKGTLFSFDPATNKEKVVWNFGSGKDAQNPSYNLSFNPNDGLFYGTSARGGIYLNFTLGGIPIGAGTIFTFNPITNAEKVVWSFGNGMDGETPVGNLILNPRDGLFYGMTANGGNQNSIGTIFRFNPATNQENLLYNFGSVPWDGSNPYGSFVLDANNGLFYATTQQGGTYGDGTIISFNPVNNSENVVWNFGSMKDGIVSESSLVQDPGNGMFYGLVQSGGNNGLGAIFSFDPATNAENVVWSFNQEDGAHPDGAGTLVYDADNGLFYGTTVWGGLTDTASILAEHGYGVIFNFNPRTDTEKVVWNFAGSPDGKAPYGSLVFYPPSIPVAGFEATDTSICAGTAVKFNNFSTNSNSCQWYFPGGTPSTSSVFSPGNIIYNATGHYNVMLIAGNGNQFDTLLMSNYIIVNPLPNAGIITSVYDSICFNSVANLGLTGGIGGLQWEYSDSVGIFSNITGATTSSYTTKPLSENTSYRVIATMGSCIDSSVIKTIFIKTTPDAGMITVQKDTICLSSTVVLQLTGSTGNIQWLFSTTQGDFIPINDATAYSYSTSPTDSISYYEVIVTEENCADTSLIQPIIVIAPPMVSFSDSIMDATVSFTAIGSHDIKLYSWNFGDSVYNTGANTIHNYTEPGSYMVCLTAVSNFDCDFTACNNIVIEPNMINKEDAYKEKLSVYPNPFTNTIMINSNDVVEDAVVYDVLGKTMVYKCYKSQGVKSLQLNVSDLPNGIYFLRLRGNNNDYGQKIIKE